MNVNHCLLTPSICLPLHPTVLHGKPTHLRSDANSAVLLKSCEVTEGLKTNRLFQRQKIKVVLSQEMLINNIKDLVWK